MAEDQVLIRTTNQVFWEITKYKLGRRLDMSVPDDRRMAKTWMDVYRQVQGHRDRATQAAQRTQRETTAPYVLVVERRDGSVNPQGFQNRGELDVQYVWLLNQPEQYTYLAAFDFTQRRDAPLYDQFAIAARSRATATSGCYRW